MVLLAWDDARRAFVNALRGSGLEVRAIVVTEGVVSDKSILVLQPGKIEAGLAKLR